jgi:hypothetical protein
MSAPRGPMILLELKGIGAESAAVLWGGRAIPLALLVNSGFFRTFRAGLACTQGLDRGDTWTHVQGAQRAPFIAFLHPLRPTSDSRVADCGPSDNRGVTPPNGRGLSDLWLGLDTYPQCLSARSE